MALEGLLLPPGRMVQGSMTQKSTTDHQNRPIPEDKQRYYVGVIVAKQTAAPLVNQIVQYAWQEYGAKPGGQIVQGAIARVAQNLADPSFSLKIEDCDTNPKLAQYAGHYLFKFSTTFAPRARNAQNAQIDPAEIKRGYFVDVGFSCSINGNTDNTAGVYLNPLMFRFLGYGPEISGGPSADQIFGAAPAQLPPGASATPVAAGPMAMPGQNAAPPQMPPAAPAQYAPQMPQAMGAPAGHPTPMPAAYPVTPPVAPVGAPAPGFAAPGALPPAGAAPGMPSLGNPPMAAPGHYAPPVSPGAPGASAHIAGAPVQYSAPPGAPSSPFPSNIPPHPGILAGPPSYQQ